MKTWQLILASALLTFSTHLAHGDIVAHWTGDDTTVDATGNGHDGTLVGDATYAMGVIGNAFSFDGSGDQVLVDANADLEPSTLSVALWVQTVQENHIRLLVDSTHGGGQAGWALQINAANNLSFAYGNGTSFPELVRTANLFDGSFHHVAATLDGANMRMYVDGALVGTQGYTGTPTASGRDIQLGNHVGLNRPLEGKLDDVRIYNHVLSQSEVTALFTGVPEPSALVVGWFVLGMGMRRYRRVE